MNRLRRRLSNSKQRSKSKSSGSKSKIPSPPSDDSSESSPPPNHKDALLQAAKFGNSSAILDLFEKGSPLTDADDQGNTALHLAAMNCHQHVCRMLIVLTSPSDFWMQKNDKGETAQDVAGSVVIKNDLALIFDVSKKVLSDDVHTRANDEILKERGEWGIGDHLLVSIDGGGVRGLITLQILLHVEKQLGAPLVNYVDWIAGTSVGGLIAMLLATGHSVQASRRLIMSKRLQVFCGNKQHRVPKHDSKGIESVCFDLLGDRMMSSIKRPNLMVTSSDSRKSPPSMVLFRTYEPNVPQPIKDQYNYINPDHVPCRKAARCTSAAPYFFESVNGFSDGAITANNPTLPLITDFFRYYKTSSYARHTPLFATGILDAHGTEPRERKAKIGCVLSLGAGMNPVERTEGIDIKVSNKKNPWHIARSMFYSVSTARNTFEMLVKEVTVSNGHPVRYSREWCHSLGVPFFRFSPQLSFAVALDQTSATHLIDMLWETEIFMRGEALHDLEQLGRYLKTKSPSEVKESEDIPLYTPMPNEVNNSIEINGLSDQ